MRNGKKNAIRNTLPTISIILLILLIAFTFTAGTAAAATAENSNDSGGVLWNPLTWPKYLTAAEKGIYDYLVTIQRPAENGTTKDVWTESFSLYISILLPLSLAILAIYIMFSSQSPGRTVLEEYVKRVAVATALAYFSFPIVDTLVWLTNEIAWLMLAGFGVGPGEFAAGMARLAGALATTLTGAAAVSAGLAILTGGTVALGLAFVLVAVFGVILTGVLVLALKWYLVHLLLGVMPVLCFFTVIGVGPLRKINEFVEHLWGLLITLPLLSILGAVVVLGFVKFSSLGGLTSAGLFSLVGFVAPFALVLAFPYIALQGMGLFSSAVTGMTLPIMRAARVPLMMAGFARGLHLERTLGPAGAALGMFLPTKIAAPIASAGGRIAEAAAKGFGANWGFMREFARGVSGAFKNEPMAMGALAGLAGAAARAGRAVDARNPMARDALSGVSAELLRHARAGDVDTLSNGLSAIHGRSMSVREGLEHAFRSNFKLARKSRDPGALGVAALLASKGHPGELLSAFSRNPGLAEALASSDFARTFLSSHGISMREIGDLMNSDHNVAWSAAKSIHSKLGDVEFDTGSTPLGETFSALARGGEHPEVRDALVSDLSVADPDWVTNVISKATGTPSTDVEGLVASASNGDMLAAERLAGLMTRDSGARTKALEAIGSTIRPESLRVSEMSEHEAARRLDGFLSAGGLVTTEIKPDPNLAKHYREVQIHAARKAVREASWREYLSSRMGDYKKYMYLRNTVPEWLPEAYEIDYRTMLDEPGYIF